MRQKTVGKVRPYAALLRCAGFLSDSAACTRNMPNKAEMLILFIYDRKRKRTVYGEVLPHTVLFQSFSKIWQRPFPRRFASYNA